MKKGNLVGGGAEVIQRLTLETPPAQPNGGGLNSTLTAGQIALNAPLVTNATFSAEFILGVMKEGNFRFLTNVEALTDPATSPAAAFVGALWCYVVTTDDAQKGGLIYTIVYDLGLLALLLFGICAHLIFAFVLHAVLRRTVDP